KIKKCFSLIPEMSSIPIQINPKMMAPPRLGLKNTKMDTKSTLLNSTGLTVVGKNHTGKRKTKAMRHHCADLYKTSFDIVI
ncbi:MAG: hypothetical protein UW81_C0002G0001, partial [Candidatus Giovannonibacteria bacterium GW2011_GWC2_44_9]